MKEEIKNLLKEKLDLSVGNLRMDEIIKELGVSRQEFINGKEVVNELVKKLTIPEVEKIVHAFLESSNADDAMSHMKMQASINISKDIVQVLYDNIPLGALLHLGVLSMVNSIAESIKNSVEMSVLGTLQRVMEDGGNHELAKVFKKELESRLSELDRDQIGIVDNDPRKRGTNHINEFFDIPNESRKDDDDDDFERMIRNN